MGDVADPNEYVSYFERLAHLKHLILECSNFHHLFVRATIYAKVTKSINAANRLGDREVKAIANILYKSSTLQSLHLASWEDPTVIPYYTNTIKNHQKIHLVSKELLH